MFTYLYVSQLLTRDPIKRLTIEQAFAHPFLQQATKEFSSPKVHIYILCIYVCRIYTNVYIFIYICINVCIYIIVNIYIYIYTYVYMNVSPKVEASLEVMSSLGRFMRLSRFKKLMLEVR
jgi:serine/threonine protein kinase